MGFQASRIASILAVGMLFACSDRDDGGTTTPPAVSLESLGLTLDLPAPALGETLAAVAQGTYSDGSQKNLNDKVTWASSNPAVLEAVAGEPGKFLAKGEGLAAVTATLDAERASTTVTVGPKKVTGLEIIPTSGLVGMGGTLKVAVVATYSDQSRSIETKNADWSTTAGAVLLPSATDKGYLVTFGQGEATITATFGGMTVSGTYMVTPPRVDYVVLSPQGARIDANNPVQYTARAHWTDSRLVDVTSQVEWTSSDPAIATIDANGLATATGDGQVVISARLADVSGMTTAHTVTSNCPYPANASTEIRYDTIMPSLFWTDAKDKTGQTVDLQLGDLYCDAATHRSIIFVVSAGWCPYCPAYMTAVDEMSPMLEAEGAMVVFVVIENADGSPANSTQANGIVTRETGNVGNTIRVGDGVTAGTVNSPFSRAVETLPNAFVVRTSDMRVIAFQGRNDATLDFLAIARNPDRLY